MDEAKQKALQKPLSAKEIDFRVQSINKGGYATILAYKDARADMHRLNKVFGVGYWQRKHHRIDGKEFCSVGIWNSEIGQWCWVEDCGTQSNTEAEKGQSSDSFKRACFNLGIGIELYDYPVIQIKLNQDEFTVEGNRVKQTWNLKLRDWQWYTEFDDDNQLTFIAAKDQKGVVRFKWGEMRKTKEAELVSDEKFTINKHKWAQVAKSAGQGGLESFQNHMLIKHNALFSAEQVEELQELIIELAVREKETENDKEIETEGEHQAMSMFGI